MARVTDEQLNKSFKSGFQPLYFLYGKETRLLQNTVNLLQSKVVDPTFASFNLQQFHETLDFEQLRTAYESLPMMAEQKLILIRDVDFSAQSSATQDGVLTLLDSLNPSTVLVFYHTDKEYDPLKKAASKKLVALIEKQGMVCQFALKDKMTLKKALLKRAKSAHALLSPEVCDLLIDRCGMEYGTLLSELDKVIAYADGEEITVSMVQMLTTQQFQNSVFDLSTAILRGKAQVSYKLLDELCYQQVKPIEFIGALTASFGDLYRAKAGQLAGLPLSEVATAFRYGRMAFRITKQQPLLSSFSIEHVRFCIMTLEKTNRLMISTRADDRIVLEQMVGEMLAYRR